MIGFIGGTGPEGRGLALRLALAGERVVIGSRDRAKAEQAVAKVAAKAAGSSLSIRAALNADAARMAEVVFVVVPYSAQHPTLETLIDHLEGKVVVDVVAPLTFGDGGAAAVAVPEGSAALQAQAMLPASKVVAAFHTVSARDLLRIADPVESDVVVCADAADARGVVFDLVGKIPGLRAVDGGGLENAAYVESLTALLLNINRRYKAHSAIKIIGI